MKLKKGITVFTPTYNRKNELYKLYNSLKEQKIKNFEWLIIDDGSTDDTKEIVEKWINESKIKIRYIYQINQGKSIAHNTGVQNAYYNLFFCVDSDDYISEQALEKIDEINQYIYNQEDVIGIIGYKRNVKINKKRIRKEIKVDKLNVSQLYRKYHYKDEIALVYKTEVLNNYLFPKINNEKFIPESYLYDQLDNVGDCYFLKEDIYYYEYLNDGYTKNSAKLLKNNINGYLLYSKQRMMISKIYRNVLRGAIQYNIACLIANKKWEIEEKKYLFILLITWIPSYLYYFKKYKSKGV